MTKFNVFFILFIVCFSLIILYSSNINILTFNGGQNLKIPLSINGNANGGYANKIYSMLSSLTIAILTNSEFKCLWTDIDKYIENPFNSSFTDAKSFNIKSIASKSKVFIPKTISAWAVKKNIKKIIKTKLPNEYSYFYYDSVNPFIFELCTNPIYYETLLLKNLVTSKTINEARAAIKKTNSTSEELHDKLFRIGFEVGGNLLNKYWLPRKYLIDKINNLYKKNFKTNYVIGIQFRTIYLDIKKDIDIFIKCALDVEKIYFKLNKNNSKPIKWYLSSDSDKLIQKYTKLYTNKIITGEGIISHILKNKNGYDRAIIDMELLSRTDELIVTGGSTFGFIPMMKKLQLGFYVNGNDSMSACKRISFSQTGTTSVNKRYAVF